MNPSRAALQGAPLNEILTPKGDLTLQGENHLMGPIPGHKKNNAASKSTWTPLPL